MINFTTALKDVINYATSIGLKVVDSKLDDFFKGDLDGTTIWTSSELNDEEELFNVLHMIGHCIQWGLSSDNIALGSQLYSNPDPILLKKLQEYEWEANCFALNILNKLGYSYLAKWLESRYVEDMNLLTHFYKTGMKSKEVKPLDKDSSFDRKLVSKEVPYFIPARVKKSRNGLVVNFSK